MSNEDHRDQVAGAELSVEVEAGWALAPIFRSFKVRLGAAMVVTAAAVLGAWKLFGLILEWIGRLT